MLPSDTLEEAFATEATASIELPPPRPSLVLEVVTSSELEEQL